MYLSKLIAMMVLMCAISGCDSGGSGKKQENETEPHPNLNLPIDEIIPGPDSSGIPSERWDEYQAYVQQTIHLRKPYNNVYEVAQLTDQGEDLHYLVVDGEGNVSAYNYLGDTVDNGADCYRWAGGAEPNSALTGKKIIHFDYQFEKGISDYGVALAGAGVEGRLATVTWYQNNLGFLNKITIDSGAGTQGIKTLDNATHQMLEHHWDINGRTLNLEIPITPDATITREYIQQRRCENKTSGLYVADLVDPDAPSEFLYQGFIHIDDSHHVATYKFDDSLSCYQKNTVGINEYLIDKTFRFDGLSNALVLETPSVPDTGNRARLALNMDVDQKISTVGYVEYHLVDGFPVNTTEIDGSIALHTMMLLPVWGEIRFTTQRSDMSLDDVEAILCGL